VKKLVTSLLLSCVFLAGAQTHAQYLKVGGEVFLNYGLELTPEDAKGTNYFDVGRVYINFKGSFMDKETEGLKINYRVTTDIKGFSDFGKSGEYEPDATTGTTSVDDAKANGYYMSFLKYAYIEFEDLLPNLKIRLGQNATPWVGYEDKIGKMRWWTKSLPDAEKKLSSVDRGISLLYAIPGGYGDMHVSFHNGEGYHHPEVSKHKDIAARLSLAPFAKIDSLKGLKVHGFFQYGVPESDVVRNRFIGALSFDNNYVTFLGEMMMTWDGQKDDKVKGLGSQGMFKLKFGKMAHTKNDFGLYGRVDYFDTDTSSEDNAHIRLIAGPYAHVHKKVAFGLDYTMVAMEADGYDFGKSESILFLHCIFKF